MSMNPALAMISAAIVPCSAKGGGPALAVSEGFAEVMAGMETLATQPAEGIATGANLRFNVATVGTMLGGLEPDSAEPAAASGVELALGTVPLGDGPGLETQLYPVKVENPPTIQAEIGSDVPSAPDKKVAKMPVLDPANGEQSVRRKRDRKEASYEAESSLSATPADISINSAQPAPALPEMVPSITTTASARSDAPRSASATREATPGVTKPTKGNRTAGSFPAIAVDKTLPSVERVALPVNFSGDFPALGMSPPVKTQPSISYDSRKGADPAPISLTAVTEIVQNLPPLVQSQVGAVVQAGPSAAIGAPADVGATLSGQVIDMGVGGQWIDRVAREIAALAEGSGHSRFQLSPPNLGRLQIDVWQGEGGGRVQLLTETDEAATRLRQDQASLQADARLSALSLDRIVIDRAPGSFSSSQDQSSQPGTGRQHQGGEPANQPGGQAGQQAAAQGNGGSAAGQGKASHRRDVFNDHTQPDAQDGQPSGRADDRHVRYA
jgi:flagellar hook-length control protein FliK